MIKRFLPIAVVAALAAVPAIGSARIHPAYNGNQTYTVSLTVNPDCNLSLASSSDSFASVDGLGWSAEQSGGNSATATCSASSVNGYVYDACNSNSTNFCLKSGSNTIDFEVCNQLGGNGCYTNTNGGSGFYVAPSLTGTAIPLDGWLPAGGPSQKGSYSDTVTVGLTFS